MTKLLSWFSHWLYNKTHTVSIDQLELQNDELLTRCADTACKLVVANKKILDLEKKVNQGLVEVEVKRTKVDLVRIHVAESVQLDFINESAWNDIYPIIKEELARKIGMQMLSDNLIEFAPMPDFPTGNGCTKNIEAFVRVAKKGW